MTNELELTSNQNESNNSIEVELPRKKKMVKRKPARKQVEVGQVVKKAPEQTGSTFNVWYGKWAGGDKYDDYNVKEKSQTRCVISTDAGYTRADGGNNAYCCLYFARGCCTQGSECSALHRLPPPASALPDSSLDVFGRERHSDYRDDMGGVGSFTRQNRTLYVGRIKENRSTAETIEKHFEEWGEIERIKILQSRGVAFVTYHDEIQAQFAKEAMMHQSLDDDEVINLRWATEDPNPAAKRAERKHLQAQGEAGIAASLDPDFVQSVREMDELEGLVPIRSIENGNGGEREYDEGDVRSKKRARIEGVTGGEGVAQQQQEVQQVVEVVEKVPSGPIGLLSADVVESLKYMASLRQQNVTSSTTTKVVSKPVVVSGLGSLAGYGSDSDSD